MDSDQGKLFVGGVSRETSENSMKDHFKKYGSVMESLIMRERNTGSPRGFGFVLFSDPSAADKALQDKHVILGKTVEVKKAIPRGEQHQNQQYHSHNQENKGSRKNSNNGGSDNQFRTKKIFVGGLSSSLTKEEFRTYFEKFGRITDVVVMYDSTTHRPRGFGFITFDSEEAVESVMQKSFHKLNDKLVEVKRAVPKAGNNCSNHSYNMRIGGGGGSLFGSYQGGIYPPFSPRYEIFPGYEPLQISSYGGIGRFPYVASVYGGAYPIGGYIGVGYGAGIGALSSSWNYLGMVGAGQSQVPYGNAAIYPGYMNGGVMGMTGCGIVGPAASGKWNQGDICYAQMPNGSMPSLTDGGQVR